MTLLLPLGSEGKLMLCWGQFEKNIHFYFFDLHIILSDLYIMYSITMIVCTVDVLSGCNKTNELFLQCNGVVRIWIWKHDKQPINLLHENGYNYSYKNECGSQGYKILTDKCSDIYYCRFQCGGNACGRKLWR